MNIDDLATGEKIAIGGAVVTIIGAFLPWVSAGFVSATGIDGDGIFTLLFGIAVLGIVLWREWGRADKIATGVLGVLTVVIVANVYTNLGSTAAGLQAGGGLHLSLIGGLGILAAAIQGYRD